MHISVAMNAFWAAVWLLVHIAGFGGLDSEQAQPVTWIYSGVVYAACHWPLAYLDENVMLYVIRFAMGVGLWCHIFPWITSGHQCIIALLFAVCILVVPVEILPLTWLVGYMYFGDSTISRAIVPWGWYVLVVTLCTEAVLITQVQGWNIILDFLALTVSLLLNTYTSACIVERDNCALCEEQVWNSSILLPPPPPLPHIADATVIQIQDSEFVQV